MTTSSAERLSTPRALARLLPFAKPVLPRLIAGRRQRALRQPARARHPARPRGQSSPGPIASGDVTADLAGARQRPAPRPRRGRHGLAAPLVRARARDPGRVRPAPDLLLPPAAASRLLPRPLAVGSAAQPHDAGHQHAPPLARLRHRAARRERHHDRRRHGAAVPLALAARHDLPASPPRRCGTRATASRSPTARSHARARTRRATSRPPSKRASTASASSRRSAGASTRSSKFTRQAETLRETELRKARAVGWIWFWLVLLPDIAFALCLGAGIYLTAMGQLQGAELIAFFAMATVLRWPMESIGFLFSFLLDARTATDRLFEVFDEENTIVDPENPVTIERPQGELVFEGAHFRYQDAGVPRAGSARRRRPGAPSGRDHGAGRPHRLGQDDAHDAADAPLRRDRRAGDARRRGRARPRR